MSFVSLLIVWLQSYNHLTWLFGWLKFNGDFNRVTVTNTVLLLCAFKRYIPSRAAEQKQCELIKLLKITLQLHLRAALEDLEHCLSFTTSTLVSPIFVAGCTIEGKAKGEPHPLGVKAKCSSLFHRPLSPQMKKPLKTVTNGQSDARHMVTFPALWRHRPWPVTIYTAL